MPIDRSVPLPIHEPAKTMIDKVAELKKLEAIWYEYPTQENYAKKATYFRDAAPAMLDILGKIQKNDAERLEYAVRYLESTNCPAQCIDAVRRMAGMASEMEAESP